MHKKKKIITIIVLVLLFIIFVVSCILSSLSNRVKDNPIGTIGNTPGNLQNDGLFCENDGVVYFSNPYDGGSLYSMKPDETDFKKLVDGNISSINSAGKYVYYYNGGTGSKDGLGFVFGSSGFFRLKKSNPQNPVYLQKTKGKSLTLIDSYLYYQSYDYEKHMTLCKIKIDGSDMQELSDEDITPSCAADSMFYYNQTTSDLNLYCWDTRSDQSFSLLAEDIYQPIIDGNSIYFIDVHHNYGISCMNLSDKIVTPVIEERVDCFNIANGIIYYQTSGDSYALKSASLDGSNSTTIANGTYHAINVTSQYVYFKKLNDDTTLYRVPIGTTDVGTFTAAQQAIVKK